MAPAQLQEGQEVLEGQEVVVPELLVQAQVQPEQLILAVEAEVMAETRDLVALAVRGLLS